MENNLNNELMTTDELAEYLRVDRITIYRYLKEGKIPALRIGGRWRFRRSDIDEWLTAQVKEVSKPKEILVVDDDESVRQTLQDILVRNGYNVSLAANGEDAMEFLKNTMPGLAIIDLKMPGMTGMELISEIRAMSEKVPIIILTAYSTEDVAIDAIKLRVNGYVRKPFNIHDFIQTVKRLVE